MCYDVSQKRNKVRVALWMFEYVNDFVEKSISPVPNASGKEER